MVARPGAFHFGDAARMSVATRRVYTDICHGVTVVGLGPGVFHGYRNVPGSTWVKSPGCYAWQVDGRRFSEVIAFDAVAAGS